MFFFFGRLVAVIAKDVWTFIDFNVIAMTATTGLSAVSLLQEITFPFFQIKFSSKGCRCDPCRKRVGRDKRYNLYTTLKIVLQLQSFNFDL